MSLEMDHNHFADPQKRIGREQVHTFPNFPKMLMSKLDEQRQVASMCDVTVITRGGRAFRAHRAVLAATSRYLEAELSALDEETTSSRSETVIKLGMISAVGFEILLDLVYTSKLVLSTSTVTDVLLAADILDLHQVSTICREFLRSKSVICNKLPRNSVTYPLTTTQDANNNVLDSNHDKCSGVGGYERGASHESTGSSSSGVSSCSSKGSSEASEVVPKNVDSVFMSGDATSRRHTSTSEFPTAPIDEYTRRGQKRPISAPADISSKHHNPLVPRRESLDKDVPASHTKVVRSAVNQSENEHSDVLGGFQGLFKGSEGSPETASSRSKSADMDYVVHDENHGRGFQLVKREPTTGNGDKDDSALQSSSFHKEHHNSWQHHPVHHDTSSQGCSNEMRQENTSCNGDVECDVTSVSKTISQISPPVRSLSYDDPRRPHPYVDLNSTRYSKDGEKSEKRHGTPDERLFSSGSNTLPLLPHALKAPYPGTPSFLASLYMLGYQGLHPASLLGSYGTRNLVSESRSPENPAILTASDSKDDLPVTTERRQLQHSHSVVSSSALLCKLCRLEFTTEWALSMHQRLYHSLNYPYQAPRVASKENCLPEKSLPREGVLAGRMSPPPLPVPLTRSTSSPCKFNMAQTWDKEHDFSTQPINTLALPRLPVTHKCYHCKKEFSSIFLLRKHKSMEHMKRPFKCHRCDSAFPNKAGLSVHLRSHTGERPYRCKVCNKAFTQLGHVQRHQKVHTGEKPYQCPLCQARVRDKASMHYHILAHQGVKPFKCDQCDARFTKRSSLVKHKNVHTGSFLYQCPQCKASFREKASLSRHVRSQHKDPCFTVSSDYVSALTDTAELSSKGDESSVCPVDLSIEATKSEVVDVV